MPLRASEVILDSEVLFVSEVLPNGKVANLTSLVHSTNFTAYGVPRNERSRVLGGRRATSLLRQQKPHHFPAFTSSKNTKPRASNLSITIIKRRESTSSLVSEQVQIAPRAFYEKQNEVRSTTSSEVKLANSICFNQKGRFNYMLSRPIYFWQKL